MISNPRYTPFFGLTALAFAFCAGPLAAQPAIRQPAPAQPGAPKQPNEEGEKPKVKPPPAPEVVTLDTKDGVSLSCTYYGPKEGVRPGKKVVPIIMVHGWDSDRRPYSYLASGLQTYGHAVLTIDLRGHGRSTRQRLPNGNVVILNRQQMRKDALAAMVLADMDAAKRFLIEKNNKGELNIELLTVMAASEGALVAINWAARDWTRKQLPAFKQGMDVKAMILLSPSRSHLGFTATQALNHPVVSSRMPTLVVAGKLDRSVYSDANRLFKGIEKKHPKPKEGGKKKVHFVELNTELQGMKLLSPRATTFNRHIANFINAYLVREAANFPAWAKRVDPQDPEAPGI